MSAESEVHQADLLFLPSDTVKIRRMINKIFKFALTLVDLATMYKEAEPLTSKDSTEVAKAYLLFQENLQQTFEIPKVIAS